MNEILIEKLPNGDIIKVVVNKEATNNLVRTIQTEVNKILGIYNIQKDK